MTMIDADVHVRWENDTDLLPYLSPTWHERWLRAPGGHSPAGLFVRPMYYDPDDTHPSTRPGLNTVNASASPNPKTLAAEWLARHDLSAAVISCYDSPLISTYGDVDYPVEAARAVNQWMADYFLDADPRLFGSITIATQNVEEAVKEIHRAAQHPRMVQVLLPAGARMPYGHAYYRPILRAAAEHGLSIAVPSGTEGLGTSNPPTPSGWPGTMAEMRVARISNVIAHLTSLITGGVFADFPGLTVLSFDTNVAGLPPYLWRFDKNWKALRSECPWVRELPNEITCRHFRFGSSGVVPVDPPEEFWRLINSISGSRLLIHASNFPRWDMEAPGDSFVLKTAPTPLQSWIRSEGALTSYPRLKIKTPELMS